MSFGTGAQTPTASADLTRLVRGLSTVQSVQNKGLTAQQAASLKPILAAIQSADKLPEAECKTRLDTINSLLTAEQKETLASLQPARGGGGGGMGKMGGGPGAGGPGGGMGGSGGGMGKMGGGAPPDPDKPFASERNKKALDDLVTALGSVK
jgi:hypothetical protein